MLERCKIPARAGVALKPVHYANILEGRPDIGFFEIHAENYMGAGGPPHRFLEAIRAHYPLSVHGVGLSIGSVEPLDRRHLQRLKQVVHRYEPGLVSEHLAWSTHAGAFLNDLLPVPYTLETLGSVCEHIDEVQCSLGRRILLENPSTYVQFESSTLTETQFLEAVAVRTGCGLLLDVTNVVVSTSNREECAASYLEAFPLQYVEEIHLAGHATPGDSSGLLIDDHGSSVSHDVWSLYSQVLSHGALAPTLIEWDNAVPAWPTLAAEAHRAELELGRCWSRHMKENVHAA